MNSFQGSERLIFEYIQCHAHEISGISAKVIASETFTTTTSVNRVCKKMGYRSYTELRYQFSRDRLIAEPVRYVVGDEKKRPLHNCATYWLIPAISSYMRAARH